MKATDYRYDVLQLGLLCISSSFSRVRGDLCILTNCQSEGNTSYQPKAIWSQTETCPATLAFKPWLSYPFGRAPRTSFYYCFHSPVKENDEYYSTHLYVGATSVATLSDGLPSRLEQVRLTYSTPVSERTVIRG